ncbi:MAG: hypothetical protein WCD70_07475 [Alphaproteobacteria bacterium]
MRFATKTALCLAISALAGATAAHADSSYLPYYVQDTSQNHLYAEITPVRQPMNAAPASVAPSAVPEQQASDPSAADQPVAAPISDALYRYNNSMWVSAGESELNYKEPVRPLPDSDHGGLASLAVGADFLTRKNLYVAFDGSTSFGNGDYNGASFDANTGLFDIPARGTTRETVTNLNGKIGEGFGVHDDSMIIPYVDMGARYWSRQIPNSPMENYQDYDVLGGLMVEFMPTQRLTISGYGELGTIFGAYLKTNNHNYDLGGSLTEKIGAKIGYSLTRQLELFSTLDFDHFHYSASPAQTTTTNNVTTTSLEPSSATEDTAMRVGLAYHFR